ncbi:MAG TPA: hypothetical protein VI759_05195 [Dehalococcoidia bacterium]|nr:hypothetical protein [Dehalococcoidia bacterium]
MNSLSCGRCGVTRETTDNFCRQCGHQLTVNLPVVSSVSAPAPPSRQVSIPPSLIGSVAVLAVGTGIEWLTRRFAGSMTRAAARTAGRALIGGSDRAVARSEELPKTMTVDEVLYVRKIQLRR